MKSQVRLIIRGKVQGVNYRSSMLSVANGLGLTGYVENLINGDVEAVACGEADKLEQLISWCWKGPEEAVINDIKVEWQHRIGKFERFEIRHR